MKKTITILSLFLFSAPAFAGFGGAGVDKNKVNLTTDQTVCGNKTFCSSHTIFNGDIAISTTVTPTEALVVDGNGIITGWLSVGGTVISTAPAVEIDPFYTADKPYIVKQSSTTELVLIGTTTQIGGSNAGIQYSGLAQNRGQIRMNQFGNNNGIAGLTGFKSRGTSIGSLASVSAGDVLVRLTGIGVTGNNANIPLSGLFSLVVATSGPLATQVPSYWEWNSTDFSGVSGVVMKTSPDGDLWVKKDVTASKFYGDGSSLTGISSTPTVLGNSFETVNSSFSVGMYQVNGADTMWFRRPGGKFLMGCNASNGECGSTNVDSEGIAIAYPTGDSLARIKGDRFGLTRAGDTNDYYFRADKTGLYLANGVAGADKTFQVVRASSQTIVTGSFRYIDGNEGSGKVLTSDGSGVASWQTPSGSTPSFETVTSTCTGVTTCTATCTGLKVVSGGGCRTNGTAYISDSDFSGATGYTCETTVNTTIYARARCVGP